MVTVKDRMDIYVSAKNIEKVTNQQNTAIGLKVSSLFKETGLERGRIQITERNKTFYVWHYPDEFSGVIDSVIEQVLNPPPTKPKRKRIEPKPVKY